MCSFRPENVSESYAVIGQCDLNSVFIGDSLAGFYGVKNLFRIFSFQSEKLGCTPMVKDFPAAETLIISGFPWMILYRRRRCKARGRKRNTQSEQPDMKIERSKDGEAGVMEIAGGQNLGESGSRMESFNNNAEPAFAGPAAGEGSPNMQKGSPDIPQEQPGANGGGFQ